LDAINREIATQTIIEIGEGAGCSDDKYLGTFEGMGWLRWELSPIQLRA